MAETTSQALNAPQGERQNLRLWQEAGGVSRAPESYRLCTSSSSIERVVRLRDGATSCSRIATESLDLRDEPEEALAARFDRAYLRSATRPPISPRAREVRVVDLFSGCGAMSLGIWEACRAVGARMVPVLALDVDQTALRVYQDNFPEAWTLSTPIEAIFNGALGSRASSSERRVMDRVDRVDVLIGGPPCQGHSDLNNHTRRADPKNQLYERMARFAQLLKPAHIVIENVPAVLHDKGRVLDRTIAHLGRLKYSIDSGVVEAVAIGVPQRRRRHFVVASLERQPDINATVQAFVRRERGVSWAIADLARTLRDSAFDQASLPSKANRERMDYLFAKNLYDLPNTKRPDCHRLEAHTYKSVYGRLHALRPAQTITSGFLCMGQGRYVHPTQRRTLTPHEGARLQFIPDFFDFGSVSRRTALAEMIGNAVPSKLAYVLGVDLLR